MVTGSFFIQENREKQAGFPILKKTGFISSLILSLAFNPLAAPPVAADPVAIEQRPARYAAIVIDAGTGKTLYAQDPQQKLHPASTTKVMTAYLVFDALKSGKLKLNQKLPVSLNAANEQPSNLGMMSYTKKVRTVTAKNGKKIKKTSWQARQQIKSISVEDALMGLITHSANDSAVVLAEAIGGSEKNFVRMMNAKAQELGMKNTVFRNPNGLPHPQQKTTVEDMAKLSRAVINDFPEHYALFSTDTFTYNGVTYQNRNKLLKDYPGADGIKTGWISSSGYNLTASAKSGDKRVIGVVFGAKSPKQRNNDMENLLDYGFSKILPIEDESKNTPVENKAPKI